MAHQRLMVISPAPTANGDLHIGHLAGPFLASNNVLLRTPTDIFPSIDIPVISVIWQYAGLNASEIEKRILYNHERSMTATS